MLSFFGDPQLKDRLVAQVKEHQRLDEIVQGTHWKHGKGCAVGCVVHSDRHEHFESLYGIPVSLAYLDEYVFENLPPAEAKSWPLCFVQTVPVGVDLSNVATQFVLWLMTDPDGVRQYARPDGVAAMDRVAALHERCLHGEVPRTAEWAAAADDAAEAARAAAARASAVRAAAREAAGSIGRIATVRRHGDYLLRLLREAAHVPA